MGGPHAIRRGRKSLKFPEEEETPPAADGGHAPPAASPLPGSAACRRPALRILHLPVPICARASFLEHSSLSLCIYTSMQTTHWLCFSGEPCCQTCPHRASHRYSASLRARETSDHRHGRTGPNVNALWAPSHSQLTPRPTRQTPAGPSSPGAAAVEKDSFARYLLKPLAGARRERAGASPASPAEAEGRDACSGAGAGRSARGAAGEVLGTQRENYSQGN